MDVSKNPTMFLTGTVTSMTFSCMEDGSQLMLKVVEREVKEGDKPMLKSGQIYLNGKLIKEEFEGPVENEMDFEQVWKDMFQKLDLPEGLRLAAQAREMALKVGAEQAEGVEIEEDPDDQKLNAEFAREMALKVGAEQVEGVQIEEDSEDQKHEFNALKAKATAAVGSEFPEARMTKVYRKTLKAKLVEEEVQDEENQEETEPESDPAQGCMRLLRKLVSKGLRKKKRSTKDASSNTKVVLELKDVSERFHE